MDERGDENFGIYLADIKAQETEEIRPAGDSDCMFMGFDKSNPEECFVGIFDSTENIKNFHIYRFNISNKRLKLIMSNPGNIERWEFDAKGRLAAIITSHDNASNEVWLRNDLDSKSNIFREEEWTKIITWDYEDSDSSSIISFDKKSRKSFLIKGDT